ncbi:DNA-binding MarR family transcriptional regulator [Microbacterium resistens]|uniref:DNA-binding MarR family transcriptional regulator n=1 Tax=Microbacterium resistens TaxID=156977 RepID=A0ABU1SBR6_9MICO|nr:MarR family winged helix-turn-helix transcriptional regulator [Microbacterium resistens]MDR6867004.1 DNA-binding MarR family transcriptional regulator [Microbacterium resistens]
MSSQDSGRSERENADPVDAITAALARLRGRGGRRFGPHEHPDPEGHGGHGPRHADRHDGFPGGPWGGHRGRRGHDPHDLHDGDEGRRGRGGRPGMPWAGDLAGRHGAPAVFRMLEALAGGELSVSAIGEAIGVDQPRASRLVQQGAERGWVRREADPDDARRTRIVLTDEGRALIRGMRGQRREMVAQALEEMSPEERAELARLLTKLADNWPG